MKMTKVLNWIIALCGLWLFGDVVAPFVPGFGNISAFVWNHVIVGFILMLVGTWAALTTNTNRARTLDWIAAAAGVWLIAASFILGSPRAAAGLWNDIAVGVVVLVLGAWAALAASKRGNRL